jgi:hypothetical protein
MGPEISDVDGKVQAKYGVGYDSDKDGKASMSISLVVEIDKAEAVKETASALMASSSVPQWAKDILAKYHP